MNKQLISDVSPAVPGISFTARKDSFERKAACDDWFVLFVDTIEQSGKQRTALDPGVITRQLNADLFSDTERRI